jgi:hypothetical protein
VLDRRASSLAVAEERLGRLAWSWWVAIGFQFTWFNTSLPWPRSRSWRWRTIPCGEALRLAGMGWRQGSEVSLPGEGKRNAKRRPRRNRKPPLRVRRRELRGGWRWCDAAVWKADRAIWTGSPRLCEHLVGSGTLLRPWIPRHRRPEGGEK